MYKQLYFIFLIGLLIFNNALNSQSKIKDDISSIKDMCGCYSITFEYAETFHEDTSYQRHKPYSASASAEWIFVVEESDTKIVLQHILVAKDTLVIKHWRQDWIYENSEMYFYDKSRSWKYADIDPSLVKGQWTQKVFQVDDSPRYEGSASWVHVDGKHYWENTTDAPLPRREYTKRSDYNVMKRTNRHEITSFGWIHEQDNRKIIRSESGDSTIVSEKGLNTYTKIPNEKCNSAIKWWDENKNYWKLVRDEWGRVFSKKEDLHLAKKREDKFLWKALFELGETANETKSKQLIKNINTVISNYIETSQTEGNNTY